MANPMNFYTLVPITPTPTEISTPASEHAFSSTGFAFPGQIDNAYYAHDSLSNQMDLQKRTN